MTTFGIEAVQEFGKLATREGGRRARQYVLDALKTCDSVQIDMIGMNVSPSFADEFFGMLAAELGLDEYAKRIQLINTPEPAKTLIAHVVYRRGMPQQMTKNGMQIPIPSEDDVMDVFRKATRKREKK